MRTLLLVSLGFLSCSYCPATDPTDEPLLLLGTIVKWQFPNSELRSSQMSDGDTFDSNGDRTVSSTLMKTTMVTEQSVSKVVEFYKELLSSNRDTKDHPLGYASKDGVSVIFSDDTEGKQSLHTVLVNSTTRSTTIVISRTSDEKKTRIVWKQYVRDSK